MKANKLIYSLLVSTILTTGCTNDFLDLDPLDSQSEVTYYKTPEQFQAAANKLHSGVFAFATEGEATANNVYAINFDYGTDLVLAQGDMASGTNSAPSADPYWKQAYLWLRPVNELLEKAEQYAKPDDIAGAVGQAYFFRAWHHFFLLKRFGGVPIMNKVPTLNSEILTGPRASRYEVVAQILSDLDLAITKLSKTTVSSTSNDGHITLEAAKALKARVCLFEGTWDKYVGTKTDGDGVSTGAGSNKPADYPSVESFLEMAKDLSKDIIYSNTFQLWKGVEDVSGTSVKNPEMYAHHSYFYLFNLEGSDSNPAGLSKSSNKEAIYRSVYDKTNRKTSTNLTHTGPGGMTRKLMDMYLCTDGLPVNISPLFKGYTTMNAELENRDYRLTACLVPAMDYGWGWGMYKTGAQYDVDIYTLPAATYQNVPNLRNAGSGTGGRKFCSELATIGAAGDEAMDYMHIRLSEVYLIYAEAVCELGNGQISDADLNYSINKVRERAGVAPLNAALLTKAASLGSNLTFLGEIRRERALELYAEGQRLSDLCRWGIAEAELGGKARCGAYITYNGVDSYLKTLVSPVDNKPVYVESAYAGLINTTEIVYDYAGIPPTKAGAIIVEQAANRKFVLKNYLQPIPTDQIKLNTNLKQNPDW